MHEAKDDAHREKLGEAIMVLNLEPYWRNMAVSKEVIHEGLHNFVLYPIVWLRPFAYCTLRLVSIRCLVSLLRALTVAMNMVIWIWNHGHDVKRQIITPLAAFSNSNLLLISWRSYLMAFNKAFVQSLASRIEGCIAFLRPHQSAMQLVQAVF